VTRLAFAGAGGITVVHGLAVDAVPGLDVCLVTSRTPATAAERAKQVRAPVGGYDELPGPADVVLVATPPAQHAPMALDAIAAGRAVIVEKPLCTTLAEADRLVAAEAAGARIGYAENLAFAPIAEQALRAVRGLADLRHLSARSIQPRPTWGGFLRAEWGGGVLFDLGVHPLALVLLAAAGDAPVAVRATLATSPDIEVDDLARVRLQFASGLEASVEASWRGPATEWDLQAAGSAGVVRLELLPVLQLEVDGEPAPWPPPPPDAPVRQVYDYGYVHQLASFVAAFARGAPSPLGAAFGRQVLDVVCGACASAAADGALVELPFDGPRHRTPRQLWLGE
jgi:predicted dehydrogenase